VCAGNCDEVTRLKSYRSPNVSDSTFQELRIWETLLKGSAASPSFGDDVTEEVDNPVYEVWTKAQSIWPTTSLESDVTCLVSIGMSLPSRGTFTNDLATTFGREIDLLEDKYRMKNKGSHYRFNVIDSLKSACLQESTLRNVNTAATDRYVDSQSVFKQLKACGQKLSEKSSTY